MNPNINAPRGLEQNQKIIDDIKVNQEPASAHQGAPVDNLSESINIPVKKIKTTVQPNIQIKNEPEVVASQNVEPALTEAQKTDKVAEISAGKVTGLSEAAKMADDLAKIQSEDVEV